MADTHLHRIPRPEADLHAALARFCDPRGRAPMSIPPQADDADLILSDGITELVAARATITRLRERMHAGGRNAAEKIGELAFQLTQKDRLIAALRAALAAARPRHDPDCLSLLPRGPHACSCGAAAGNRAIDAALAPEEAEREAGDGR